MSNIYDPSQELPPELKVQLEKAHRFWNRNREIIILTGIGITLVVMHKGMTRRIITKSLKKAIETATPAVTLPSNHEIFEALYENPGLVYVEHGNGILHFAAEDGLMVSVRQSMTGWHSNEIMNLAKQAANHLSNGGGTYQFLKVLEADRG